MKKSHEPKKTNEELKQQTEEYLDGWKRCKADFENFKKQQQDWATNFRIYATEEILQEIIPIVDNFELALNHIPETPENNSWREGILHIKKQLEDLLACHNIKKIEVKPGDHFNPSFHECIENQEDGSENQKNPPIIERVLRNGYALGEKILRPAQVSVK